MLTALSLVGASCVKEVQEAGQGTGENQISSKLICGTASEIEQGSLLVKFSKSAVEKIKNGENVLEGVEFTEMDPLFAKGGSSHELDKWYELRFDESISPKQIAFAVAEDDDVETVEYNSLIRHSSDSEGVSYSEMPMTRSAAAPQPSDLPFNDPMLPQQWHLINNGDQDMVSHSVAGADLGVKDAWRLCTGDTSVVVAVFDIGVCTFHTDLQDVMWKNTAETTNGRDDDQNGYKDDIYGYNFKDDKGKLEYTGGSSTVSHGTHVAGSIAARNGNGKGVSSIAGGSGAAEYDGVRIMSCQIFGTDGSLASASQIANAFKYAADNGACIAQCSFGAKTLEESGSFPEGSAEYEAMQYFINKPNCKALDKNLVIFAAGNYGGESSLYPGLYPCCITVTAFGPDYLPGGYSNHGTGCDIAAPGGNPCLVEDSQIGKDMRTCILSTGLESTGGGTYNAAGYVYNFGTSMACPQVSGVAALGLSYALKLGKTFSRDEFVSRLLSSADDIDRFMVPGSQKWWNGKEYVTFDPSTYKGKMGAGAVNAWNFLMSLEGTPTVLTAAGKTLTIDLAEYTGAGLRGFDYTVSIDEASKEALGIDGNLSVDDGMLTLECTKIGAGKITLSGGITDGREDGFVREISIVSRSAATNNGGWM